MEREVCPGVHVVSVVSHVLAMYVKRLFCCRLGNKNDLVFYHSVRFSFIHDGWATFHILILLNAFGSVK